MYIRKQLFLDSDQEIYAHSRYSGKEYPICYWRTASQLEIDFVLGDHEVAIEVKATEKANHRHLKGLKAFAEEYETNKLILISNDPLPRLVENILILPWKVFFRTLMGWGYYLIIFVIRQKKFWPKHFACIFVSCIIGSRKHTWRSSSCGNCTYFNKLEMPST